MSHLKRLFLSLGFLFFVVPAIPSQSPQSSSKAAVITGRVTIASQPAATITVALFSADYDDGASKRPLAKAVTDAEGRYRLAELKAGSYKVAPMAPGYVSDSGNGISEMGNTINLEEGESVEEIDFSLRRGAVITGRVTDANHQPLVEERVTVKRLDGKDRRDFEPPAVVNLQDMLTDDRGVYRIYGLPPGRYKVCVGEEDANRQSGHRYHSAFYPGATDEARAEIIELIEGGEATNIDITVGAPLKTYSASGRVVDADTGIPVADAICDYGIDEGLNYVDGIGWNRPANARGEFRIEDLTPGRYAAFVQRGKTGETYSEPAVFEVKDADVSGLEVKVRRGATISGVAVVEGTKDPKILSLLSSVTIEPVFEEGINVPPDNTQRPTTDGSFTLTGLPPGKVWFYLVSPATEKRLSLIRVELNGEDVTSGFPIKAGEQVKGVRLILKYGSGSIRGQVRIEGNLPANGRLLVFAGMKGNAAFSNMPLPREVDSRGRFVFESLPPGDYEISILIEPSWKEQSKIAVSPQSITVSDGAETQVNVTVYLKRNNGDR